jgi:hypothetical protein
MTVNEVYTHLGQKIFDAIPENIEHWDKAIMYIDRLEGYTATKAILYCTSKEIPLDDLDAGFNTSKYIHFLYNTMTEEGHNRWNKLEFTLLPTFKFDLQFIWNQKFQDEIDGYNKSK